MQDPPRSRFYSHDIANVKVNAVEGKALLVGQRNWADAIPLQKIVSAEGVRAGQFKLCTTLHGKDFEIQSDGSRKFSLFSNEKFA